MAALNTIVDAFVAKGNTVTAASVPHEHGGSSAAGQPLRRRHAAQPLHRRRRRLLPRPEGQGPERERGPALRPIGATEAFPETVREAITIDGEVLKIPTGVHIDGIVYYNKKVAEAAGVDPTKWTSLDEMLADQQKVNDAGKTFIAMGGNTFQAGYTFHPLLAAVAGPEIYNRFYAGTPDETVFDEPGLRETIEVFRKITAQTDEGWVNRAWNDTTNTVIAGDRADADPRRLDEGPVAREQQGARRRLRLRQHPRRQGAVGDGGLVRHPRRRRRGDAEGRGGLRRHRGRPEDQRRVRLSQGIEPGPPRRADRQARRLQRAGARVAEEAGLQRAEPVLHRRSATGSIRSGTRCTPSRATPA